MSELKKIVPLRDWILVKPADPGAHESQSGLLVPSNEEQEKKAIGDVLAVGEKVQSVLKGSEVVFGAYAGETLKRTEDGEEVEYKLLMEEDIIAILQ